MKTVNVLFELGTEELPASCVRRFPEQLSALVADALTELALSYADLTVYATPRRLTVYIQQLPAQQPDRVLEKQGPQEKVAFNAQGEPTPAGLGFARSCQIDPSELKKYCENGRLLYRFTQPGSHIESLLPELFANAIMKLSAGKTMRWGNYSQTFIRPIRWVVLLINDQLVKGELFGLSIQRETYGHRFLSSAPIVIKDADHYVPQLLKHHVMVDQHQRRHYIIDQLKNLPQAHHGIALMDEDLLDEVTGLVEWPVALLGSFSPDFLQVPAEALISSMQQHQKYFPIIDGNQNLLPYFIFISNLSSQDPNRVIQGNERVLHARLYDAAFFFQQDKQIPLAQRLTDLSTIVYQEQLGSLYDKTQRVMRLCNQLGEKLLLDQHHSIRAAELSLCDLTTSMVQEFPELQGTMGYYYAHADGEPAEVCQALAEQYLPRYAGDQLPNTLTGCALAIAQRLDTLVGQFAIGNKPSGEKDPFALRRCALGLMRILIEKELDLDMQPWLIAAIELLPKKPANVSELATEIWRFCLERLRFWYMEQNGKANYFIAVSALPLTHPYDFYLRLQALNEFQQLPASAALIAAHKRVKNILARAEKVEGLLLKPDLLTDKAEKELARILEEKHLFFQQLIQQQNYVALLKELALLRPYIDAFFDNVMVMVDDPAIRENRLALLSQLRHSLEIVADISELE